MTNQDTCITRIPVALKERILSGHTKCLFWRVLQLRWDAPVLQTLAKVRKPFCVAFHQWLPSPITRAKPAMCTSSWHYMPWDITAYAIKQHNCVITCMSQWLRRRQRRLNDIQQCKNLPYKIVQQSQADSQLSPPPPPPPNSNPYRIVPIHESSQPQCLLFLSSFFSWNTGIF